MSLIFNPALVQTLRRMNDVVVNLFGVDCTLHIPNNLDTEEKKDLDSDPSDLTFDEYKTKVFLELSQDKKKLRKLGIYTEDDAPMLAWFKIRPEPVIRSWFKIDFRYPTDNPFKDAWDDDTFEIVDVIAKYMHDIEVIKLYKIAPRREKV